MWSYCIINNVGKQSYWQISEKLSWSFCKCQAPMFDNQVKCFHCILLQTFGGVCICLEYIICSYLNNLFVLVYILSRKFWFWFGLKISGEHVRFESPPKYNKGQCNFIFGAYRVEKKNDIHKIQKQHFFPESMFYLIWIICHMVVIFH